MYIYIERENMRERERWQGWRYSFLHVVMSCKTGTVSFHVCIYIERERAREREREREVATLALLLPRSRVVPKWCRLSAYVYMYVLIYVFMYI